MIDKKRIYKYISITSSIIAVALIVSLMVPSFTLAQGESVTMTQNENELSITTKINAINVNNSALYVIKSDDLTIPTTPDGMENFANNHVNEIKGVVSEANQTFTCKVNEAGKYYAVVLLMENKEIKDEDGNSVTSGVYTSAISANYVVKFEEDNKQEEKEDNKKEENKAENNQEEKKEQELKQETKTEINPEDKKENKPEIKQEPKKEQKVEQKVEQKNEEKSDVKVEENKNDDVLQIRVIQQTEANLDKDNQEEYPELVDESNNKEDSKEIKQETNKKADKKVENQKAENKEEKKEEKNTKTDVKTDNNTQNSAQAQNKKEKKVEDKTVINKNENVVKEKLPQTGDDKTGVIISIVVFSLISIVSFIKYKKVTE